MGFHPAWLYEHEALELHRKLPARDYYMAYVKDPLHRSTEALENLPLGRQTLTPLV